MSTSKNQKKEVAKPVAKKVVAKVPVTKKVKKDKNVIIAKNEPRFVSFSVRAVIPTQQYGNIQPEITVEGGTYEEARDIAMPHLEALYQQYAMRSIDGSKPDFFKASVTATEKKVEEQPAPAAVAPSAPVEPSSKQDSAPATPSPKASEAKATGTQFPDEPPFEDVSVKLPEGFVKSEFYIKAEKAIMNSLSIDALTIIEDQVSKSVKIAEGDKQYLVTLALKKRKALAF